MEPRAHHILIGVFVFLVAICAVLFSLWLGPAGSDQKSKNYTVVFTEAVRGLNRGSAVQYNGIRVGEITNLELDPKDIRRVLVHISVLDDIPITQDTKARLALTGITGSAVIELIGGDPDSPLLDTSDPDNPPLIEATPSPIAQLLAGGEELLTRISDLLTNATDFLSADNAKNLGSSFVEFEKLLKQLNHSTAALPDLLLSLQATSESANQALSETSRLLGEKGHVLFDEANNAMKHLATATEDLQKMLANSGPALEQGSQGFAQLAPLMQELRQTIRSIQTITQGLDENPANYLFGGDSLQEFQP